MAEVISASDPSAVERAVTALQNGKLLVVPTDTAYAVIADAFQNFATQRLFGAKQRARDVPLSLMIRNPRQVIGLATDVPESAERLMASYWPGLVTIVLQSQPDMPWDLGETQDTVALRMPANDLVLAIAADVGPLACSAANRRGQPAPLTVEDARLALGEAVDLYIDGGTLDPGMSTIVDCTRAQVEVLREGRVPAAAALAVATGAVDWGQVPDPEAAPEPTDDQEP
jgi:tRNA threonylcarbamoyl adenosine modification protein (Sua5/YciO/YrdC/YwlC family)